MYIYIYIYTHTYIHIDVYTYMCICIYACIHNIHVNYNRFNEPFAVSPYKDLY